MVARTCWALPLLLLAAPNIVVGDFADVRRGLMKAHATVFKDEANPRPEVAKGALRIVDEMWQKATEELKQLAGDQQKAIAAEKVTDTILKASDALNVAIVVKDSDYEFSPDQQVEDDAYCFVNSRIEMAIGSAAVADGVGQEYVDWLKSQDETQRGQHSCAKHSKWPQDVPEDYPLYPSDH